jgi:hypothetical protein
VGVALRLNAEELVALAAQIVGAAGGRPLTFSEVQVIDSAAALCAESLGGTLDGPRRGWGEQEIHYEPDWLATTDDEYPSDADELPEDEESWEWQMIDSLRNLAPPTVNLPPPELRCANDGCLTPRRSKRTNRKGGSRGLCNRCRTYAQRHNGELPDPRLNERQAVRNGLDYID